MKGPLLQIVIALLCVFWLTAGCISTDTDRTAPPRTTNTASSSFTTEAEKIDFLAKYIHFHSAVDKAEFRVIFQDNSGGLVPGPSDWDIRAVLHVADTDAWIKDKVEREPFDLSWAESLYSETMKPTSEPHFYESTASQLAVFEQERIILFYANTLGE